MTTPNEKNCAECLNHVVQSDEHGIIDSACLCVDDSGDFVCSPRYLNTRQWKCDNCNHWNDDDGSGNDYYGYSCERCDAVMYPITEDQKMTWRRKE